MLQKSVDYYGSSGDLEEEIATLETKIKRTNIGYSMLTKLGWKEGEGLGIRGNGGPYLIYTYGAHENAFIEFDSVYRTSRSHTFCYQK